MAWKKDSEVYNGKSIVHNGFRIFNPSEKVLKEAGYIWEEPVIPTPPDRTQEKAEFAAACSKFREVCSAIGELIGKPDFKGGFDEMAEFEASAAASTEAGIALSIKWMAADKLCTYLAKKLHIGQPQWWYKCWEEN